MKLSDIVYPIITPIVGYAARVYLRKIYFSNRQRIPKDRPVLFISNHPTAFLEPVIYTGTLESPVHCLVRGNLFQKKLARTALEALNLIPIYRMIDGGVEGVRKNVKTFQYCYDLLEEKEHVLIMAEGITKHQKKLGELQRGAARMALGAAKGRGIEDLLIVPIGANFTEAEQFRGEIMIDVGEPMEVEPYLAVYKKDKKEAVAELTKDMAVAMKKTIVHIADDNDVALFEKVVPIARRNFRSNLWPSLNNKSDRFNIEKKWADYLNNASDSDKFNLAETVEGYPLGATLRSDHKLSNWIVLILGFPLWVIGCLYRTLPFTIARRIVKNKIERIEFVTPVRYGMGVLFMILLTVLMFLLCGFLLGWQYLWIPFLMIIVVHISIVYEDVWKVIQHGGVWNKLSASEKTDALSIENELNNLL